MNRSFTLIEVLVTVGVFALVMGAVFGLIFYLYRTHSLAWQQALAIQEARRGITVMVKEIREAVSGEDGSYPVKKAGDKEFVFFSDIDKDGEVERVRYFLGGVSSGNQEKECYSFSDGGSCGVSFSNILTGDLVAAELKVSAEGDLGWSREYIELYADGEYLGRICGQGCSDCAGTWQGDATFDVTEKLLDGELELSADSSLRVDAFCDWGEPNHSTRVRFDLSWQEEVSGSDHEFKKGVVNPTGEPPVYDLDQEKISILSSYVRNSPPVFEYYDSEGNKITEVPARLADTKLMKVFLIVNVDPNRSPRDLELESYVKLRNLKNE